MLLIDLFPPGAPDPQGMHGALWDRLGGEEEEVSLEDPLTLASYVGDNPVTAYVEHLRPGLQFPEMPLFLDPNYYVNVPLEATYETTWRGTAEPWRRVLENQS